MAKMANFGVTHILQQLKKKRGNCVAQGTQCSVMT